MTDTASSALHDVAIQKGPGSESRPYLKTTRRHMMLLVLMVIGSGALRALLSWPSVFAEDYISFLETDAWYHMRLVDALVADFPWRLWHDPYLSHPGGEPVNAGPVFDWLIAAMALAIGGGSPTSWQVDMVGVLTPPILGALTLVPVYVLGRELWSSDAGLWAAFMVAVLPSQMLDRSLLGFTDHHCLETLLSTTMMMCLVLALKRDAVASKRWALYGGVAFGTYLLTWGGGVLFVAFIVVWAGLQLVADALRGADSEDVTRVIGPMLLVAAVMVAPWGRTRPYFAYQFAALVGGTIAIWAMHAAQRLGRRRGWGPVQWLATIATVGGLAAVVAMVVLGDNKANLLADASRISPFRRSGFVSEARPLIRSDLWYPLPLWREFTTAILLAMMGFGVWARECFEGPRAPWAGLLGVWSLTMIGATLGQVRFTYYLGVNIALFAGLSCVRLLERFDHGRRLQAFRTAAVLVTATVIAAPGAADLLAKREPSAVLNPNWQDALSWLRNNTPDPFNTSDAYLHPPPAGSPSAYGVMAWWDYGYWITRVAQRVPVSNPKQTGVAEATGVLLATTPADASRVMDRVGARYLIVNWQLQAAHDGKASGSFFGGMVIAAGGNPTDYCEMYAARDPATERFGEHVTYCYPEYYRTMAMRLYLFGGKATMPPGQVTVVASQRTRAGGVPVREITGEWTFDTYEAASAFVENAGRDDLRIVSKSPQATCVPLEAVEGYRQVFRSLDREGGNGPHAVQIFEYAPATRPRT